MLKSAVDGRPYQESKARAFCRPNNLLQMLSERVTTLSASYLVYCGTYATIDNVISFGTRWTAVLDNPRTGRHLALRYDVVDLMGEVEPGFRVPLRPEEA